MPSSTSVSSRKVGAGVSIIVEKGSANVKNCDIQTKCKQLYCFKFIYKTFHDSFTKLEVQPNQI